MSDEKEVVAKPASEDPKSLQNGLGLEALLDKPNITKLPKAPSLKKKVEKVAEADDKVVEPKTDAKEKVDAKSDELPDLNTLQKQLKDTRDYATKVNQKNIEMERSHAALLKEVETLKAKMDGTYIEPTPVPHEQQSAIDKFLARIDVDNAVMMEQYGQDVIQKLIWDPDSPYQQLEISDPSIKARIHNAKRPVQEAYNIVQEHLFFEKYGRDPQRIKEALLAEAQVNVAAEIRQAIKGKPIESVNSLTGVSAASRQEQRKEPVRGSVPDLKTVFPTFANQHQSQQG